MDDANVPSLLSSPPPSSAILFQNDSVYQATRARLLSADGKPLFHAGSVMDAIGGPHDGPGYAWLIGWLVL